MYWDISPFSLFNTTYFQHHLDPAHRSTTTTATMDEHHDGTINSVPATDGAATVGQHDSPSPEHQQGIVEHDVASEQATVPYEDIEVVAAEDAEVVDDPRMRVLCDMHNEVPCPHSLDYLFS